MENPMTVKKVVQLIVRRAIYPLIALIPLFMAGCSTCPPTVVAEAKEVKVPVPVPCISELPQHPDWELNKYLDGQASLFEKWNAALIELEQRREYEAQLEALMVQCSHS